MYTDREFHVDSAQRKPLKQKSPMKKLLVMSDGVVRRFVLEYCKDVDGG